MPSKFKLVLSLIFAVIIAVFILQNSAPVHIGFLFWRMEVSQALVILISVLLGAVLALLLSLLWKLKSEFRH